MLPSKRPLWLQAVELERQHAGSEDELDEALKAASERLPWCPIRLAATPQGEVDD